MKQMQITGLFLVVFSLLFFSTVRADALELSELSVQVKQNNRFMSCKNAHPFLAGCSPLVLCFPGNPQGTIEILNKSDRIVTNIIVQIPAGWNVQQNNIDCQKVGPGDSCFIQLTATSGDIHERDFLIVEGDFTEQVLLDIAVNDGLFC